VRIALCLLLSWWGCYVSVLGGGLVEQRTCEAGLSALELGKVALQASVKGTLVAAVDERPPPRCEGGDTPLIRAARLGSSPALQQFVGDQALAPNEVHLLALLYGSCSPRAPPFACV
jgi:hypothetical protein